MADEVWFPPSSTHPLPVQAYDSTRSVESIEVGIFKVPPQNMAIDEPAAIVKINTQQGSIWDGGQSL
jgi:hypothetical protein